MEKKTLNLVVFVQGTRGIHILRDLQKRANYKITGVVIDEGASSSYYSDSPDMGDLNRFDICHLEGKSPNDSYMIEKLRQYEADVFVLAGCRHILRKEVLALPKRGTIGIHNGKLPEYRGSSPLNWALIRGCFAHYISVMEVSLEIDGGRVIKECRLPISIDDTIRDLHDRAVRLAPKMMAEALEKIVSGAFQLQNVSKVLQPQFMLQTNRYLSRRFPSDGGIHWQHMTAWQVHNMIRALTDPYPCAYTQFQGKKWRLHRSRLSAQEQIGKEGRIYDIQNGWMLVAAKDRCLWVKPEEELLGKVERYALFDSCDARAKQ